MKTLSTNAAAAALGVERKTLDNILAREARSLLKSGSRGRSRRIPVSVLERVAVALILNRDAEIGLARGLELAEGLLDESSISLGPLTTLAFDVTRLRKTLERSIDDALESIAEPTRGRPRA
jgi:hypothetical protein